ncbi:hypothetical protein TWF569_002241 [Orbilia oligospora]|nr:hypothetical protein TWF569_002241 [Orbilia oligospora]
MPLSQSITLHEPLADTLDHNGPSGEDERGRDREWSYIQPFATISDCVRHREGGSTFNFGAGEIPKPVIGSTGDREKLTSL